MALAAHGEQRYGDRPYVVHLVKVVENLHRFGVATPELEAAAWLHDTVEDTELTLDQVRAAFGDRVAELVHAVTTESGADRHERNARTYPKLAATPGAVRLKLADRIANVEASWEARNRKLFMYHEEYPAFREALRDDSDHVTRAMWAHLDALLGVRSA
ncbi:MAG: HD domain-containing protein [Myxococcota bacterium]